MHALKQGLCLLVTFKEVEETLDVKIMLDITEQPREWGGGGMEGHTFQKMYDSILETPKTKTPATMSSVEDRSVRIQPSLAEDGEGIVQNIWIKIFKVVKQFQKSLMFSQIYSTKTTCPLIWEGEM